MPFENPPDLTQSLAPSARRVTPENEKEVPFGGIPVPAIIRSASPSEYGQLVGGEVNTQGTPVVESIQPSRVEPEVGEI